MSNLDQCHDTRDAGSAAGRAIQTLGERVRSRLPRKEIRTFARFLILTAIFPAIFLSALLFVVGWKIGTIASPSMLSLSQQQDPKLVLLPPGGLPKYAGYKLARIKDLQPYVIYVGHSRCGQMRAAMFKPYSFYNACLTSWTLDQIREFIERTATVAKPSIVIIELDYFMFTKDYKAAWTAKATMDYETSVVVNGLNATLTLAEEHPRDLLAGFDLFRKPVIDPHTGFELRRPDAVRAGAGFRYDGSFMYSYGYRADGAKLLNDAVRQFLSSVHGGPGLDPQQLEALSRLASSASKLGIKLVGVQLPIYAPVVDYLDTDPVYHDYAGVWRAFQSDETRRMFERLGITFFDTVRLAQSREARNFVDPAHPSEIGLLSSLVSLSSDSRFRSTFPMIDPERLRGEYQDATQRGQVYDIYADRD